MSRAASDTPDYEGEECSYVGKQKFEDKIQVRRVCVVFLVKIILKIMLKSQKNTGHLPRTRMSSSGGNIRSNKYRDT